MATVIKPLEQQGPAVHPETVLRSNSENDQTHERTGPDLYRIAALFGFATVIFS